MQERSLYKTIRDDLLRAIENGSLQPDQALPSERELCQRYGTSRMTVRHAVTELESLGSVYRMQGKGTFVSGRKLIQPLMQVSGFTEDMAKRGKKASSQILFAGEKKADAAIARGLRIAPGEPYILIRRLRLADGVPMAIENTALNASLCRGVLDTDLKTTRSTRHSRAAALRSRPASSTWKPRLQTRRRPSCSISRRRARAAHRAPRHKPRGRHRGGDVFGLSGRQLPVLHRIRRREPGQHRIHIPQRDLG